MPVALPFFKILQRPLLPLESDPDFKSPVRFELKLKVTEFLFESQLFFEFIRKLAWPFFRADLSRTKKFECPLCMFDVPLTLQNLSDNSSVFKHLFL